MIHVQVRSKISATLLCSEVAVATQGADTCNRYSCVGFANPIGQQVFKRFMILKLGSVTVELSHVSTAA